MHARICAAVWMKRIVSTRLHTAMQELPDQYLDTEITRTLKFKPVVTPLQKQAARDRLLTRAAEQTMLPPLIMPQNHQFPCVIKWIYLGSAHAGCCKSCCSIRACTNALAALVRVSTSTIIRMGVTLLASSIYLLRRRFVPVAP